MGGGQSLTIGLTHLEQFAWVVGMSASVAKREFVLGGVINGPKVAIRGGQVRRLVVYKLDRLGRSLTHLALILDEINRVTVRRR